MSMPRLVLLLVAYLCFSAISGVSQSDTVRLGDGRTVALFSDHTWRVLDSTASTSDTSAEPIDTSCSNLTRSRTDKMTGETMVSAASPLGISADHEKGLIISLLLTKDGSLIFATEVVGASSCIDENTKINILFSDGSKMELTSDNKYNCDGKATIYFGNVFGKEDELSSLLSKRISAMRVWTMKSYVEEDFTERQSSQFYYTIRCLWDNGGTRRLDKKRRSW